MKKHLLKSRFDEENKMMLFHDAKEYIRSKEFYKFLRLLFILFASPFFIVNMVIIYGYRTTPDTSFTSFGFTLVSLAIACHAVVIAIDSDEKMKAIVRTKFRESIEKYQDSRFDFLNRVRLLEEKGDIKGIQLALEIATWESVNCMRDTEHLKKWVTDEDKDTLIEYLENLVGNIMIYEEILKYRHFEHLLMSCKKACELNVIGKKHKSLLIELFKNYIGDKEEQDKDFCSYLERKLKQVREKGIDTPFRRFN